ncbi:YslB family protein [Caldibacillus lycopersici]|uniref:YslB family protein n=2 Tax=Perspicuibacillus lycopersici TaxID=1325689 RepID=A0AAE3IVH8_9BACI|nr:YslB family protein [Perspicuibacillus lycopersici]
MDETLNLSEISIPAFGYELIREELINELLGKDGPSLLYWAGKRLARKYPLFTFDEIKEFFIKAGWGSLQLEEQKKNEMELTLTSDLIQYRLHANTNPTFQLEAGFLAEQIQQQKKLYTEAYEHPKKRDGIVSFTIKWDNIPLDL